MEYNTKRVNELIEAFKVATSEHEKYVIAREIKFNLDMIESMENVTVQLNVVD